MARDLVLGALIAGLGACSAPPAARQGPALVHTEARCPAGFEDGPESTCFALPPSPDANTATVLYVHSASNDATIARELDVVKTTLGTRMGVLFVRGSESECALSADVHAARCWPQAGDEEASRRLWERWDKVQWQAEALLPEGVHPRLVLGFKEGAAFAVRAFKRGAIRATMTAAIAPGEAAFESGAYPQWLVGIGVPASAATTFTQSALPSALCTRPESSTLTAADLTTASDIFHLAVRPPSRPAAAKMPTGPCTLHPARSPR